MAKKPLDHNDLEKRRALKTLIESEVFQEAAEEVKRQIADDILRSNDPATRERLYFEAQNFNRLLGTLESYKNDLLFLEKKGDAA